MAAMQGARGFIPLKYRGDSGAFRVPTGFTDPLRMKRGFAVFLCFVELVFLFLLGCEKLDE